VDLPATFKQGMFFVHGALEMYATCMYTFDWPKPIVV